MTLKDAVSICVGEKYAQFSGRASRAEYWWFALATFIYTLAVMVVFLAVNGVFGGFSKASGLSSMGFLVLIGGALGYIGLLIPSVCVTVRRFHDVNLSGWWVLVGFALGAVPLVGWIASIAMFVVTLLRGTAGDNRFGPNPLI